MMRRPRAKQDEALVGLAEVNAAGVPRGIRELYVKFER